MYFYINNIYATCLFNFHDYAFNDTCVIMISFQHNFLNLRIKLFSTVETTTYGVYFYQTNFFIASLKTLKQKFVVINYTLHVKNFL